MHRALRIALLAAVALGFWLLAAPARAEGVLAARGPDGGERGAFPLTRTEVRAEIQGQVVSTSVTQRFENTFAERIEAVYLFPLPDDSAVDDMEMRIGDRVVSADIKKRAEAQATYARARDTGRRAALLEQQRPNMFTFSVANVDPGKAVEVRLHYFQIAHYDHGTYEMAFPMVVGPRFTGIGTPDAARITTSYTPPATRSGHTVGLAVHLDAGAEIESVESPAHQVTIARPSPSVAAVALKDQAEIPNRDFILRWRLDAKELKPAVFAHRPDAGKDGYLELLLEPRHGAPASEIAAREIFFLLDTSGSMEGPPIATAVKAVRKALATLNPSDSFQIIDFADTASTFSPTPLANTPENVRRASEYLGNLNASGGTNQLVGIHAALAAPGDAQRLRYVVFMTDGYIGNESQVIGLVQREIGAARIFSFGVGSSVNRYLLDEVAIAGRGAAEYIRPGEDSAPIVERFYQRIGRPYLTDIQVDWGSFGVTEVQPAPLPDLSTFQPLVLFARYRGAGAGTIEVRGRLGMRPFSKKISVNLPAVDRNGSALSRLWAREKISTLSRRGHWQGETPEIVEGITTLGLEHRLVTRFTSFVAVDPKSGAEANAKAPLLVQQPGAAPQGVNLGTAGGTIAVPPTSGTAAPMAMAMPPGEIGGMGPPPDAPEPMAYPAPPPPAHGDMVYAAAPPGRHGCAGCAVAGEGGEREALAVIAVGAAIVIARRRRRAT
jgi:Ca-activated chloride channel family protein